ncbi:DUF4124 domain-containing protein [Pseudoteredinibacter isoporae]|uniref:Sec-independent protein translocase protein TatA n=1 Tax=Pseudoteredinibacter isoporae TaxID=570281 RepID=A0A7X0JXP7_9GAMM|nr:DUF4124 domain-containing protein [Pseudoteredinibacter isoporae]MBB6523191.1 Sec-independent protein translocase protein TatA [Pseudoteredinibacter isoporae]NHO88709.1 DUF4124 domain-containing protein [Pseudoteredinibacter isoporae]NIB22600.1 DUF4124 domain-containing protein [Pseudoteredinibacter isoporae]
MRLFIVLIFAAVSAQGSSVYKCTDKHGNPVYSDKPCKGVKGVEAKVSITPPPTSGSSFDDSDNEKIKDLRKKWDRDKLEKEIKQAKRDILRYRRAMDSEVSQLEQEQRMAANNLAGAQYHSSLSTQIRAATQKYTALIEDKREEIKAKQSKLEAIE